MTGPSTSPTSQITQYSETWSGWPKVTQPVNGRAWIQTQVFPTPKRITNTLGKQGLGTLVACQVGKAVPRSEAHPRDHGVPWDRFTATPQQSLQRRFSAPCATCLPDSFLNLFLTHRLADLSRTLGEMFLALRFS